jgi:hypothetical protein
VSKYQPVGEKSFGSIAKKSDLGKSRPSTGFGLGSNRFLSPNMADGEITMDQYFSQPIKTVKSKTTVKLGTGPCGTKRQLLMVDPNLVYSVNSATPSRPNTQGAGRTLRNGNAVGANSGNKIISLHLGEQKGGVRSSYDRMELGNKTVTLLTSQLGPSAANLEVPRAPISDTNGGFSIVSSAQQTGNHRELVSRLGKTSHIDFEQPTL